MQRNEGLQVIKPLPTSVRESQKCGYVQKRINLNLKKKMSKRITAAVQKANPIHYHLHCETHKQNATFIVLIEY